MLISLLTLHILALVSGHPQGVPVVPSISSTESKCENITVPMCRGIGYNLTAMPNQFNHYTQEEAGLEVHQFWPLVEIQCSPYLRFFLCSMYAPICMPNYKKPVPACREVCEIARNGCLPIMDKYGFAWPDLMDCNQFPNAGDKKQICMNIEVAQIASHELAPYKPPGGGRGGFSGMITKATGGESRGEVGSSNLGIHTTPHTIDCECQCRAPLVLLSNTSSRHHNRVVTGGQLNCAVPCQGLFFTDLHEKTFARFWIGLWSCLCICSTLLTCLTFLVDTQRFQYPERPTIYLSFCLLLVSLGYIIPIFAGHEEIACEPSRDSLGVRLLVRESSGTPLCTLTFVLLYFFGMAASSWWVILALTWFLAAGLKWGQEVIGRYAPYFHVVAWGIPAAQTGAALALQAVDGDSLAGLCYIGNLSATNIRYFLLLPLALHVLVGAAFLITGLVALCRVRTTLKRQGTTKTGRLEKLMLRIGVFSVLYTVPLVVVVICHFYEQHFRTEWEWGHNCKGSVCPSPSTSIFYQSTQPLGVSSQNVHQSINTEGATSSKGPDFSAFMLKYFMSVMVGITSGFWVWSGKTVEAWRSCYRRICCCCCCRAERKDSDTLPVLPNKMNDSMLPYHQQHQQLLQHQQYPYIQQQYQPQLHVHQADHHQSGTTATYSQVTRPSSGGRGAEPPTRHPSGKRVGVPVDRTSSWGGSSLLGCGGSSGETSTTGGRVNVVCSNGASCGD